MNCDYLKEKVMAIDRKYQAAEKSLYARDGSWREEEVAIGFSRQDAKMPRGGRDEAKTC
jgi:hypothetical protein